jgi:hypothetical protein
VRIGPLIDSGSVWPRYLGAAIRRTPCIGSDWNWAWPGRADGTVVAPAHTVDVPTGLRIDFDAGAVWFVAAIPQLAQNSSMTDWSKSTDSAGGALARASVNLARNPITRQWRKGRTMGSRARCRRE